MKLENIENIYGLLAIISITIITSLFNLISSNQAKRKLENDSKIEENSNNVDFLSNTITILVKRVRKNQLTNVFNLILLIGVITYIFLYSDFTKNEKYAKNETNKFYLAAWTSDIESFVSFLEKSEFKLTPDILSNAYKIACERNNAIILNALMSKANDTHIDIDKITLNKGFHYACDKGFYEIVKTLVDNNIVDIEAKNEHLETPLYIAACGGNCKVMMFLIEKGADINARNNWNETPLMHAAVWGHKKQVELLLNANADFNCLNIDGCSAIMLAVEKQRPEIVKLLLNKPVDLSFRNNCGEDVYDILKRVNNKGIISEFVKRRYYDKPYSDSIAIKKVSDTY